MSVTEQLEEGNVSLADMIESLRHELESAQRKGMNRAVAFGVEKVELELKVVLSRKVKGTGGVKFWVVSAEGAFEGSHEATQNFKLTLSPLDAETRTRLQVANEAGPLPDTTR